MAAVAERPAFDLTLTADDFGLSLGINEAVEMAHRRGALTDASLMIAGPAAADAVARAHAMPTLRVGLHVVAVEGPAALPAREIPELVDKAGWFPSDQVRLGLRYAAAPAARAQLAREIDAQFAAFAATGLALSHVDAHKHMHLHPYVAGLVLRGAVRHGARRVRVPREPPAIMRRLGERPGRGAEAMYAWAGLLLRRARRTGLATPAAVFGVAWSGAMTEERLARLVSAAPAHAEIYLHPATRRDALLRRLMPNYRHEAELAALLSPSVLAALAAR